MLKIFKKYSRNQIFKEINQESKKPIQEWLNYQRDARNIENLNSNQEKNAKDWKGAEISRKLGLGFKKGDNFKKT